MKKILTVSFLILGMILFSGCSFQKQKTINNSPSSSDITESEAISIIKNNYPEFKEYPSNNLPPKSIKTEKGPDGWYVAFVQEGSGRPIISAKCYLIDNQKNIMSEKTHNPAIGEDSTAKFSPITCTPGACALQTCHGFNNISCGSNPPDVCTEMYEVGDKCLQYAKCGIKDNKCQPIENSEFTQCKSCVQKCIDDNKNNDQKEFECENKCK